MTDPKKDNYRTVPAFNYEFEDLAECIASAVLEFSKRPAVIFVIMRHSHRAIWLVLPWTQYRSTPVDHPCHSSTIVFRGNLFDLRKIAYSFPPDLFGDPIFDTPDHRIIDPAPPNEAAEAAQSGAGNDSDPDAATETIQ